ncbi:ribulose-1,5 bisphosphate carboxylase/oxygenase large subunit N-methyltransferase, chloroplastic isoform X1 [Magnolia sinica]|uniref:ribulose-1,5 bisphosphate carboxylase/oxygenase large subunit N-methyltransferase, chloroplastic isoform X1 n=1 Tax=Magnolia sinica TaxID=86752 RepID=UPI00265A0226|nr:ribulose-1,5 bisphosphate carboxylase/oxygenase large subunit N-methyltransferase, chloroplastic isoform X1 [Magnolia sinica]
MASSLCFLSSLSSSSLLYSAKCLKPRTLVRPTKAFSVNALSSPDDHYSPSASSPALQNFWQWLCEKGLLSDSSPAVKPGVVAEGLGLVAQRDISRNEVVVQVPKKLWINPDSVAASDIGRVCSGLKPWISVALFLLHNKSRLDSQWRPYLDILPHTTNSTIFWSEEELSELQGTQLLSTTLGVKDYVQSEFVKVKEEVLLPHNHLFPSSITLDDFLWAFGILRSRAFSRLRGENLVLIPLADLINHSSSITSEEIAWEIKGTGLFSRELVFSLRSPVSVKAGEQVLIQYDLQKSNAELALDYGFIESSSDREAYTLTLEISESDPFFDDKLDIAESNGLGETAYFDIVLGRTLPPAMLPFLRLVALGGTDAFLLESIFRNSVWGHLELPVSRANEELICQVVRDACKSALSGYFTSVEEDEKLMEAGNLDPRLEIAVGIRAGEKKVLHQIDKIFEEREMELDGLEYYQERRLKDLGLVGEQGEIIFWESK